jgi:hypothetical protein
MSAKNGLLIVFYQEIYFFQNKAKQGDMSQGKKWMDGKILLINDLVTF